jgi:hypothetical protein
MTFLEALHWIGVLKQMPEPALTATIRDFVYFYLTNPVHQPGCPFRKNGACCAYASRTFACRAYGLWSQKTGNERTAASREARASLRRMWRQFRIELPAACGEAEMPYCDKVDACTPDRVSDEKLLDILKSLYRLSKPLAALQNVFEETYQSDVSFLVSALALGHRKAVLGKYAVIKEIVNNNSEERLQKTLSMVTPAFLDNVPAIQTPCGAMSLPWTDTK